MTDDSDEKNPGPGPQAHYPQEGEVLSCDFSGLREPEMIKNRPVVVMSVSDARPGLAIVVPLSSTEPIPLRPWHHKMSAGSSWDRSIRWAKCDMIYSMSYDRLSLWRLGRKPDGSRQYLANYFVDELDFAAIQDGMRKALKLK